jgi:hypothetical protein
MDGCSKPYMESIHAESEVYREQEQDESGQVGELQSRSSQMSATAGGALQHEPTDSLVKPVYKKTVS